MARPAGKKKLVKQGSEPHNGLMLKLATLAISLCAITVPATAADWMTDLQEAQQLAVQQQKPILINFTGSDWCSYCKLLEREVLQTSDFMAFARDKFILVEIDVPRKSAKLTADQIKKNKETAIKFGISGFPTIMVISPEGQITGGFVGNPTAHKKNAIEMAIGFLTPAYDNYRALQAAEELTGPEQTAALHQVYQNIPSQMRDQATGLRDRILQMDTEDTTGLRAAMEAERELQGFTSEFKEAMRHGSETDVYAVVDRHLVNCRDCNRPAILHAKVQYMISQATTVEDIQALIAPLEEICRLAPSYAPSITNFLQRARTNPQSLLDQLNRMRSK